MCVFSNKGKETLREIDENTEAVKCVTCQMNFLGAGNGDKIGTTGLNGKKSGSWFQVQGRMSQIVSILINSLQRAALFYS